MPVRWQSLLWLRLLGLLLLLHLTIRCEGRAAELRLRLRLLLEAGAIARRAPDGLVLRGGSRVCGKRSAGALEAEARGILPLQDPLARYANSRRNVQRRTPSRGDAESGSYRR